MTNSRVIICSGSPPVWATGWSGDRPMSLSRPPPAGSDQCGQIIVEIQYSDRRDMQSPQMSPGGVIIGVSTTFFPSAILPGTNNQSPDLILISRDSTFFYCHRQILLSQSTNLFGGLITSTLSGSFGPPSANPNAPEPHGYSLSLPRHALPETSTVANLILHIIYSLPSSRFAPHLSDISDALRCLDKYGLSKPDDSADIWIEVVRHGKDQPIQAYALAASYATDSLCVQISQYTLGTSLTQISEADALSMGPIYLRKLFFLHLGRAQALKRVIDLPPTVHEPSPSCSSEDALQVTRGWELAVANILVHPNLQSISSDELSETFGTVLGSRRMCSRCLENVRERVNQVIREWKAIKMTI